MENENNENLDSLNEETGGEDILNVEDATALKEKIKDISDKNRLLFERAKKAEGFEKDTEGKWVKKAEPKPEVKPEKPVSQPDEVNYGKLAFLNTKGVNDSDDIKIVQDEADRLKLPLSDVLSMEHIKAKLTANREQREAQAGLPRGQGRSGGVGRNDVEYYIANPDKRPDDQETAEKVLEAKMASIEDKKFSDQ